MNHNVSAQKIYIILPVWSLDMVQNTKSIKMYGLIHLSFRQYKHYRHLSKKDPPRNLRVTPGFGTPEDPTAPHATAGACEAAACLFRVEMGLEVPTCQVESQILQIFRKSNELILILN
jgi:hypothetical protein